MAASVPTTLGFALLGLVHIQPQTGYSLRKVFETTPMGHYSSSPGAIYPALKRLEQQGLIAGETKAGDTLRPRRVYSATALGVDTLRKWVSQPVTRDELIWKRSELMLRFSFMGSLVDESVTVRFLEQILETVDDYLPELEAVLAGMAGDHPPHGHLALAAGIEGYRGLRRWAREAIEAFSPTRKRSKP